MLGLLKSRSSNFTIHYIYDVFTLNNSKFDDYVDLIELDLDLHIDNDSEGRLRAKLKDKRDDFNFT